MRLEETTQGKQSCGGKDSRKRAAPKSNKKRNVNLAPNQSAKRRSSPRIDAFPSPSPPAREIEEGQERPGAWSTFRAGPNLPKKEIRVQ